MRLNKIRITIPKDDSQWWSQVASLGPVGFWPAPGTWGSLWGLIFWASIRKTLSVAFFALILLLLTLVSVAIIHKAAKQSPQHDPPWLILDEFVGLGWALVGIQPLNLTALMGVFIMFRIFDMGKPGLIGWIDNQKGNLWVLVDDLWAGCLTGAWWLWFQGALA